MSIVAIVLLSVGVGFLFGFWLGVVIRGMD